MSNVATAEPEPAFVGTVGARMFAAGGDITATIGTGYAAYNSDISLYRFNGNSLTLLGLIGNSVDDIGKKVVFQDIAKGTEIVGGIYVKNTGLTFYSGPWNAVYSNDSFPHASIQFTPSDWDSKYFGGGPVWIGFEDLSASQGSDQDHNDAVVCSLSGVSSVPEPLTVFAVLSTMGPAGLLYRRRRRV